ncbi:MULTISPECIES: ATP-binding cassette domain-containing protein [Eubacterium]|uniref:ATP-binding cassette domain-containing protein n=1 Tax=Eubacterium TaxID=1730 RepID=UPI001CC3DD20|nr:MULTISPECIES: ATP-binding cassette domain-containing protein [Eubacterium]
MIKKNFPETARPKTAAEGRFEGVYPILWRRISEKGELAGKNEKYFNTRTCPKCGGERLNALSRSVTVNGTRLPELSALPLEALNRWVAGLESSLKGEKRRIAAPYLLDLKTKLRRIINVGLGYLTLDRQAMTLSGGEAQRIKLAAALDAEITGIIYILDEPTVGLHPKDTEGVIRVLQALRDQGNTVIVIEHDPDVMAAADHMIDVGPGAGIHGGQVVGQGTLAEIRGQSSSVTGQYLKNENPEINHNPRSFTETIKVQGARLHNIKGLDVRFPIRALTAVTGVSDSGKSTLVFDILGENGDGGTGKVSGLENFDAVVTVEQSDIARMKRSNVATYSGAYSDIRKIFGCLEAAKEKGMSAKHFSFNTRGGRCENCEGLGRIVSNMLFFENIETVCPVCGGRQFNEEVLSVKFKGCSIHEVLKQPVEKALKTFEGNKKLEGVLGLLQDVGLGYLELGQTLTTLSGGEGQRLKLARELMQNQGKRSLYLIDEPTTGIHPLDIEHFIVLLNRMVDNDGTVVVVEHNAQLIRQADWIIDLGPEGGDRGGKVIFEGTPAQIIACRDSVTGPFL